MKTIKISARQSGKTHLILKEMIEDTAKENRKLKKQLDNIKESILNETTTYCNECSKKECCPEKSCIIWRIEQLGSTRNN